MLYVVYTHKEAKMSKVLNAVYALSDWIKQAPLGIGHFAIERDVSGGYVVYDGSTQKTTYFKDENFAAVRVAEWFLAGEGRVQIADVYNAITREEKKYEAYIPDVGCSMQIVPYPYFPSLEVQAKRMSDAWDNVRRKCEKYRLAKEREEADKARKREAKNFLTRLHSGEVG